MIDNTASQSHEEEALAAQADLNAKRAAHKATMTPEQAAKMAIIEECVGKLETAQIPFVGWFATDQSPEGYCDWWQFNRFAYDDDYTTAAARTAAARGEHLGVALRFLTQGYMGTIVSYSGDHKPRCVYCNGEFYSVKEEA